MTSQKLKFKKLLDFKIHVNFRSIIWSHHSIIVVVLGEQYKNSGIFQTFCKDEITELLPKTARIQLDRRRLLFGEYQQN